MNDNRVGIKGVGRDRMLLLQEVTLRFRGIASLTTKSLVRDVSPVLPSPSGAVSVKKVPTTPHHPTKAASNPCSSAVKASAIPLALGSASIFASKLSLAVTSAGRYANINGGGGVDVPPEARH